MLETLFRKRFVVVHLALSAVLAFLLARTVTAMVADVVVGKLTSAAGGQRSRGPTPRLSTALRDFVALANANIFDARREVVIEESGDEGDGDAPAMGDVVGEAADTYPWWDAPRSGLRLRLVGTMAFADQTFSLASILDEASGGPVGLHSVNDCQDIDQSQLTADEIKLMGKEPPCNRIGDVAMLRRIEPERVYIFNSAEGRIEYVALNEPPAEGPPALARTEALKEPSKDELGSGIVKTAEGKYAVPRSDVDGALNNLSELATMARIVPAFEGGKPVGFKLFSIRPGSLYSKIGLQNGDVISRINGYEMTSPEKGLELYQKLKDSAAISVDVKRRGKPMTLDYSIQ